ncbi:diguanylate cyclase response regulator [Arthrobacter sp. SRS-W-1-2016]|uniref:GGDEF domain-containing response regulator n=1 Tax=Arthrobacter TaxID=1663 RepID=UPI000991460E|nr:MULTISPECIES: diguanylate cyclase [Arthrobacter]MDQ0211702.1 two-component system chemotaxis response regulator CheY [Arthrobacter bambusae]MDQ0236268.1 two-component system chemotaxis response regulator CheY [Arthrobacter bambusae]OOP63405.1 diguanylate cyclase response regulator [Arthrobacter sp. SRS-W-1-2016]
MKVLVADDDYGSRLVAKAAVEQSGHECIVAADGSSAWELYRQHRPQVVVTDLMMPGLNGLELCRAIRSAEEDSYTYLVLVTSKDAREDVVAGMHAGADDYVAKPLDPFALHTRLLVAQRVTSLHTDLARYRAALAEQARTDPLTKLHNRLKLSEDLERLHDRSARYGTDYSLAICDVDNFKRYNDLYGHQAGDLALQSVAASLAAQGRESDGIYRFGGEEFLFLLPGQTVSGAEARLARALEAVRGLGIAHSGNPSGTLTLSAGLSAFVPDHRVSSERLLKEADMALYTAKSAGRNRVEVAPEVRQHTRS